MAIQAPATTERKKVERVKQEEFEIGNYPCRIAQVIDLGVQVRTRWDAATNAYVPDEEKAPAPKIMVTYEFTTEFMKDADGNDQEDRPRWLSEDFHVFALDNDLATSTKRYLGVDPKKEKAGDWAQLIEYPVTVTVAHKKNGKAKVGAVSPPMKGMVTAPLKNPPKVFELDNPDMEIFNSLPDWLKDTIKANINYAGSPLEALVGGKPAQPIAKPVEAPVEPVIEEGEGDDNPW